MGGGKRIRWEIRASLKDSSDLSRCSNVLEGLAVRANELLRRLQPDFQH